jgi:hypothetical protein
VLWELMCWQYQGFTCDHKNWHNFLTTWPIAATFWVNILNSTHN